MIKKKTAHLGRVLIGSTGNRGKGWGTAMIAEALDYSFNILGLKEIDLAVFDFNSQAISCYEKIGFVQYNEIFGNQRS